MAGTGRYESRAEPLAPRPHFASRLARALAVGLALVLVSLAAGMAGYIGFEGMSVLDAFVNTAMILSGMGPLDPPKTTGGKLFAGLYALYSGFAVLVIAGIVFAPIAHRLLHRFHAEGRGK